MQALIGLSEKAAAQESDDSVQSHDPEAIGVSRATKSSLQEDARLPVDIFLNLNSQSLLLYDEEQGAQRSYGLTVSGSLPINNFSTWSLSQSFSHLESQSDISTGHRTAAHDPSLTWSRKIGRFGTGALLSGSLGGSVGLSHASREQEKIFGISSSLQINQALASKVSISSGLSLALPRYRQTWNPSLTHQNPRDIESFKVGLHYSPWAKWQFSIQNSNQRIGYESSDPNYSYSSSASAQWQYTQYTSVSFMLQNASSQLDEAGERRNQLSFFEENQSVVHIGWTHRVQ